MAAIFNFRLPATLGSIRNRSAEFLDPEDGGRCWNGEAILSISLDIFTSGLDRHIGRHFEFMLVKNSPIASGMLPWLVLCCKTAL